MSEILSKSTLYHLSFTIHFLLYNKCIMKRHLFWIVELFIWLLILFLVSGVIMLGKYNYKKTFNTYQIFLTDVDGLINGSPVKLMGIQIGYVNQIDIVGEDVYVKFVVTEPHVKIPAGSVTTVEFAGMGGSKSLEIYPPKPNQNPSGKLLIAQSPKRIHDSLGLLNDMFDKFIEITYDVSHFMSKFEVIRKEEAFKNLKPQKTADEFLDNSNTFLDKAQGQLDKFGDRLKKKDEKDERRQIKNH